MPDLTKALLYAQEQFRCGQLHQAEATCLKILVVDPQHVDALLFLGVIANQLGKPEQTIECFRKVIAVKPDHFETCKNLGFLYRGQGKLDEAIECYRKALLLKPDDAEAHSGLGDVFCDQERLDEAVESYQRALSLRPDFAQVYCNLGGIFLAQDKLDLAMDACRRALALDPRLAEAYVNLGSALVGQGDTGAAADSLRNALELKADCPGAREGLASLYAELGRFEDAHREVAKALASNPDNAVALSILPEIQKMPVDADWLNRAQRVASKPTLPLAEAMRLLFAIGKYHDDNAQYDHAFAAYSAANALRRRVEGGFDRAAFSSLVDALISAYAFDAVNAPHAGASASRVPVFIVGMPRSGTSLVEQIIASHPQAFGAGELSFWHAQARKSGNATALAGGDPALLAKIVAEYEQLLHRLAAGKDRVVDKMPHNFLWLGMIRSAFPNAQIIHTQRNPLDTCVSIHCRMFLHAHQYAADLEDLGHCYCEYLRLMRHWRSVLPADRFLELPYEGLVNDQAGWTRKLLEFVQLPWADSCMQFHRHERRVATFSSWQVRQPIYRTAMGHWAHYAKHIGPLIKVLEANGVHAERYASARWPCYAI